MLNRLSVIIDTSFKQKEKKMTNEQNEQICEVLGEIAETLDKKLDSKNDFGEYKGDILHNMEWHLSRIADALEKIASK